MRAGRGSDAEVALPVHLDDVLDDGAGLGQGDGRVDRRVDHGRRRPRRVEPHERLLPFAVFQPSRVDEQLVPERRQDLAEFFAEPDYPVRRGVVEAVDLERHVMLCWSCRISNEAVDVSLFTQEPSGESMIVGWEGVVRCLILDRMYAPVILTMRSSWAGGLMVSLMLESVVRIQSEKSIVIV